MNVILGILVVIGVAGVAIAIYEHRKKRILLAHDLTKDTRTSVCPQDHAMNLTIHQGRSPSIF